MPPRPRFDRRAPVRELPNINERINYPELRVVDSDGQQLGVIDRLKALEIASKRELDLVLVHYGNNMTIFILVQIYQLIMRNLIQIKQLLISLKNKKVIT